VPSDRDNFLADENPPSAPTLIQVAFAVEQMRAIAQVRASVHAIWQNDRTDVDQKSKAWLRDGLGKFASHRRRKPENGQVGKAAGKLWLEAHQTFATNQDVLLSAIFDVR
jgi:hypothetical protein